jgi:hypothetical protein
MDLICRCRSLIPLLLEIVLGRNASSQSPRFRIKELRHTHSPADCSAYDLTVLSAWSATFLTVQEELPVTQPEQPWGLFRNARLRGSTLPLYMKWLSTGMVSSGCSEAFLFSATESSL